jgi:hypothetical protein
MEVDCEENGNGTDAHAVNDWWRAERDWGSP